MWLHTGLKKYIGLFLSLYFLFAACFPRTDFSQIQKIPELIAHLALHGQETQSDDIFALVTDFVVEHYIHPGDHHSDGEDDRHQDLPLKSMGDHSTQLITCEPILIDADDTIHAERAERICLCHPATRYSSVFRPPLA